MGTAVSDANALPAGDQAAAGRLIDAPRVEIWDVSSNLRGRGVAERTRSKWWTMEASTGGSAPALLPFYVAERTTAIPASEIQIP